MEDRKGDLVETWGSKFRGGKTWLHADAERQAYEQRESKRSQVDRTDK